MAKKERGISDGGLNLQPDREIDRDTWLREVFPEWKTYLNEEIDNTVVEPGTFALWRLGGAAIWIKTPEDANIAVDLWFGTGGVLDYNVVSKESGIFRMSGAEKFLWHRTLPHFLDPFAITKCDAYLSTHIHTDHCDFYAIKNLLKNTDCVFVGPPRCCEVFERFKVPKDRIMEVTPGNTHTIKDVEITALESFDRTVLITEQNLHKLTMEDFAKLMDQKAANYFFKMPAGTLYHAGDSHYSNGFFKHGRMYDVDVAMITFGDNPDGLTDKMTPYDCYRAAKCLKAKVLIPMHYADWSPVAGDPTDVEMIAQKKFAKFNICIMNPATKFVWPKDRDEKRIEITRGSEYFRPELVDIPFPAYL